MWRACACRPRCTPGLLQPGFLFTSESNWRTQSGAKLLNRPGTGPQLSVRQTVFKKGASIATPPQPSRCLLSPATGRVGTSASQNTGEHDDEGEDPEDAQTGLSAVMQKRVRAPRLSRLRVL